MQHIILWSKVSRLNLMRLKIIKSCKTTSSKAFKSNKMSNWEHFSISKQLSRTRWKHPTPWASKSYSASLWPEALGRLPTLLPLWTTDPLVHTHRKSSHSHRCPTIRLFKCRSFSNRTPRLDLLKSTWASFPACRGLQRSLRRLLGCKIILPWRRTRQAAKVRMARKQR